MAVKYFIRYFDIKNVEHLLNIYDDNYVDEAIQIEGKVTLDYSDTDDALEAIRGQGLSVELEADANLNFSDLWSEEEKTYRVNYYRNDEIIFKGWLNPEGFYEDFVGTNWKVTFDCVDGLGFLSDLSFVEDATGFPITGRKKYIQILALALERTGLKQGIYTSINTRYTDLEVNKDPLDNVYANTERYVKDDGKTIMSCEEVIRDILEPFGAVVLSFEGLWYIYKPNQLYNSSTATFFGYSYRGTPLDPVFYPPTKTIDLSLTLGSDINGFYPHHCSANQSIRNESSVGAYRVNYKYGLVQSLLDNTTFYTPDGINIDDWTILDNTYLDPLVAGGSGLTFRNPTLTGQNAFIRTNKSIIVSAGLQVDFLLDYSLTREILLYSATNKSYIRFKVILADSNVISLASNIFYLKEFNTWTTTDTMINFRVSLAGNSYISEFKTPVIPDGFDDLFLFFEIIEPIYTDFRNDNVPTITTYNEVRITPSETNTESEKVVGEFHTVTRLSKPSSRVDEVKTVATGDNLADFYEGTIYKADAITPTTEWFREGVVESKPLLRIMCEENLRLNQSPTRVFSGDIYGYFNYFSVININGLDGVFLPIKYSYDTVTNIVSATFKQIYGAEIAELDDSDAYKYTLDYGNTVKPTIK